MLKLKSIGQTGRKNRCTQRRAETSCDPHTRAGTEEDELKHTSVLASSNLDGMNVLLKKLLLLAFIMGFDTHLAQELEKQKEDHGKGEGVGRPFSTRLASR